MQQTTDKLRLYQALELRAEYDGRIKTLKDCLPEARSGRSRFDFGRGDEARYQPSEGFDLAQIREQIRTLEYKRRKLNSAIQAVNFQHRLEVDGEEIHLGEALEIRKGLNSRIGELHSQVVDAAYQRVIYKEDRDIVEDNNLSYTDTAQALAEARQAFRRLNCQLRAASFEVEVDFRDD